MSKQKPTIKIDFSDFFSNFDKRNKNPFIKLLSPYFNLEIVDEGADFLIYSCFGNEFRKFKGIRIFYSGENIGADFNECDFALTHDFSDHPRHFRFPCHLRRVMVRQINNPNAHIYKPEDKEEIISRKTNFCSFLVSNSRAKERVNFFHQLSKYKKIDSAGKTLNNMLGPRIKDQLAFHLPYKFNLCFENASYPGYTTEKIAFAMMADCIPIYWGDPEVGRFFNTKSFINVADYASYDEAIEHIIEIDNNEELYRDYLSRPFIFTDEETFLNKAGFIDFIKHIFNQKGEIRPVAQTPYSNLYPYKKAVKRWYDVSTSLLSGKGIPPDRRRN
ncbi:MAG: hypothetical protein ACI85O_001375 [Saprospiraceae bacterium]|jgi:hypothetical protein